MSSYSFQIIPSITLNSGTGIRLKGMCNALNGLGRECTIAASKKKPDFVIASKTLPNSCIKALLQRSENTRAVLDFDDLEWSYWENNWFMKNALLASERLFVKKFDYYTVHTEGLRQYLQKEYKIPKERILFFGQGIYYAMFEKARPDKDSQRIVYAGHLGAAAKGITEIFKAFAKVSAKFPKAELEVIGDGMFRKNYESQAAEISSKIFFSGHVPHEKIPQKFSEASIAVNYMADSSANRYRSSIKVREYLAAGLPTLCNEIGDVSLFSEYIEAFPTNDFKAFEQALCKTLSKPNYSKANKGREFVKKNWDWGIVARKFLKELEAVA